MGAVGMTDEMASNTATPEPPSITVTTRIRYWPDRLRLALSILRGNQFSLRCYVGDVSVNGAAMNGAND